MFHFNLEFSPYVLSQISTLGEVIPGVKVSRSGAQVTAPENCAFLVEKFLRERSIQYTVQKEHKAESFEWRESVATSVKLTPYQDRLRSYGDRSLLCWWPTGSGKTLGAILWARSNARSKCCVFVTRASARQTIAGEIARYAPECRSLIVTGEFRDPSRDQLKLKSSDSLFVECKDPRWGIARRATVSSIGRSKEDGVRILTKVTAQKTYWRPIVSAQRGEKRIWTFECGLEEIDPVPDFVIVGWESLPLYRDWLESLKADTIILDEVHKGQSHRRWKAVPVTQGTKGALYRDGHWIKYARLDNIASAVDQISKKAQRRLGLTGTPIMDRVRNLWAQLDLIDPRGWGAYYTWARRYCDAKPGVFGGIDDTGSSNLEELLQRLSFLVHAVSREETHRDLPARRFQTTFVPVEDQDRIEDCQELLDKARTKHALAELELFLAAARKRTAAIEIVLDQLQGKDLQGKLQGNKVVVFTGRKVDCEDLGDRIRREVDPEIPVWVAHGDTAITDRDKIRQEYMAHPGPCCLVGTGYAWGESVSLHDTDLALFVMIPLRPGDLDQWVGRFWRKGQKRPVLIHFLVAERSADEHVYSLVLDKLPALEKVGVQDLEIAQALFGKDSEEIEKSLVEKIMRGKGEDEDVVHDG